MRSFHLYLGRLGLLLGQFAVYRARKNTHRPERMMRWYRLAFWAYRTSSPLGMLIAAGVGIEAAMMQVMMAGYNAITDDPLERLGDALADDLRDEAGNTVHPGI